MPWEAIAPAGAAFLLAATVVLYGATHPAPPRGRPRRLTGTDIRRMLRHLALLGAGGLAVLVAVTVVFSVWLLGDPGALRSVAWSGPFLLCVAALAFVGLSWLEGRLRG